MSQATPNAAAKARAELTRHGLTDEQIDTLQAHFDLGGLLAGLLGGLGSGVNLGSILQVLLGALHPAPPAQPAA